MCKGTHTYQVPKISIAPGIQVPSATNNSSSESTFIKDSINTVIHVTITSGTILLIGFLILAVIVLILHHLVKTHHRVHGQRLNTLASLTGFGKEHVGEGEEETSSTKV